MKKLLLLLLFVKLISFNIYPQNKGEINGKIIDKFNKQPLNGVLVEILNSSLKTETDESGNFSFKNIDEGNYTLKYSYIGYKSYITENIIVISTRPVYLTVEIEMVQTDEIVIESETFSKPLDISNSIKSLKNEEIRRSPGGFEDIGRVLQTLPGVTFINDGRNDLIVRGGSPAENLFLIDNSPIPNINHFGTQGSTGGPISIVNLDFIKDVNFITGGFSARYGDRLSSVLDIKLREGNRKKVMSNLNLSATGFGAVIEGPVGKSEKGSFLLSARRSYLDLIFNAAGFGFVPEYYSFQFKGVYDLNKKNTITINGLGNIDKVKFNNDTEENKQNNEDILKNNQWGYTNSFELKTFWSFNSYSLINFTRNYTNFDFSGRDSLFRERFRNLSTESNNSLKVEFFWEVLRNTQLSFGTEGNVLNTNYDIYSRADTLYVINPNSGGRYILPEVNFSSENTTFKGGVFAQVSTSIFERLKLNLGIRYDYFDFINRKHYISPRASFVFNLTNKFNFNFSYGIFYQTPSSIWLVSNSQNKQLENIRADHYIAGLEYLIKEDTRATVEFYYKKYSNYPASTVRPYFILANNGGDFQTSQNFGLEPLISAGYGFSKGVEFFLQKTLTKDFFGTVNLSIFEVKYTSLDGIERESDYNNRILLIANGGYNAGKGWEFTAKFRFVGGRPFTPINQQNGLQDVSKYNSERLPDYYSLDVRVDKRWSFKKWALVTYIDIQNITGRKNVSGYKWNKYKSIVEARESIGIIPSIGINAMF